MRIAIVEDNVGQSKLLTEFIQNYCENNSIDLSIQTFSNGESFLQTLETQSYEIAFIDIFLNRTLNGLEVAKGLTKRDERCLVIFTTASRDFAVESYRLRAFDYILKPYTYEQIEETLDLCSAYLHEYKKFIRVKEGRLFVKIYVSDIIYTDYYNHYIQIFLKDRVVRSHMSFQDFYELVKDNPQFLNCYRNCLINMDRVDYIEERDFVMVNGHRVPIAKNNRQEILQRYQDYKFEKLRINQW